MPLKRFRIQNKCEILVRMADERNIIPPSDFIPAAERYNLMGSMTGG